jgi:integrase
MSKVEARRFLESAQDGRYHALWVLLLTCGLRPSEAFALTWEDVDWEEGRGSP